MAIAPLQLPGPLVVPQIDWSPLNAVGDAYVKNQEQQREAAAIGDYLTEENKRRAALTTPTATAAPNAPRSSTPTYPRIPYSTAVGNMLDDAPPEIAKDISVSSGLRTNARQAELYDAALKKYGSEEEARKWVAPPGQSQHEKGNAADLQFGSDAARQWAHDNASKYGLTFPLANEPWHIETADARGQPGQSGAAVTAQPGQSAQPGQLTLGLRNNNPGYIPDGAVAKSLPGYKGAEGGYAVFETPEHGLGAMDALLTSFGRRGIKTGAEVARQLPGTDSNNADAMARFVSPNGDPNAAVDLSDPQQRQQMAGRLAIFANGMHTGMGMTAPTPPPTQAQMAQAAEGMSPDQIKRVQALYAAGPNARTLANSIIGKYIGKQEYKFITGADGTIYRTNETTGTVEPVSQTYGTTDVKRPGAFGTTDVTTMQRTAGGLMPLRIAGETPATATPAAGEGATGEEYLKTLKPAEQDVIRKIANYETDPRLLARGGPGHAAAVMSAVARFDPTYDQALYPARAAAFKEFFAGGNSSPAGQITAGNTAIQHLGRVLELSDKLGGTDNAWILNKPINWLNAHTQEWENSPDLVRYKGAMDRFVEEATKFYRGTGGNEADINRALSNMTAGQSPEARTAAIREQAELMQSKINALGDRLKNSLGPALWKRAATENPQLVITQQKSADVMSKIRGEKPATPATPATPEAPPAPPAPAASAGPPPAQVKAAQANPKAQIDAARAAIAAGQDRGAVIQRLQQFQIPIPSDL